MIRTGRPSGQGQVGVVEAAEPGGGEAGGRGDVPARADPGGPNTESQPIGELSHHSPGGDESRQQRVATNRRANRHPPQYRVATDRRVRKLRRRLFAAKAERLDTAQLELEFATKLRELDDLNRRLGAPLPVEPPAANGGDKRTRRAATKPTGRRDLRLLDLPEERIELIDPVLEGTAKRIDWDESCKLSWRRAGFVRLVIARAKYRDTGAGGDEAPMLVTTPPPPALIPRGLASPALLAHVLTEKFCDGLPFHRQEDRLARIGTPLDRGTMCRWAEHLGATVGATVVAAMHANALATAFSIAADATGVLVQPIAGGDQARRGCRHAHFLVQIADADHVFFEYLAQETSATIGELFRGFSGYVQVDAKSTYDFLFRPPEQRPPPEDDDPAIRHEVGCWSHCRRKFWEAAVTSKDAVAREAVLRIKRVFDLDRAWRDRPHAEIKVERERHLRPHTDAFFAWVAVEYARVRDQRGLLRTALGYAHRQHGALTRFFDDGRLKLTNNNAERELRRVATGRKAWLFVGSDDHGQAAGNLLSLIASARLHRLDPEAYLRDLFRVLPHWPSDRYLELCPRDWTATRARLDADQLRAEFGPLTVPAALAAAEASAPTEQPASS
jgi:transposase